LPCIGLALESNKDGFRVDSGSAGLFSALGFDPLTLGRENAGGGEHARCVDGNEGDGFLEYERDDEEGNEPE